MIIYYKQSIDIEWLYSLCNKYLYYKMINAISTVDIFLDEVKYILINILNSSISKLYVNMIYNTHT